MAKIIISAFADEYSDSFEEQLQGLNKLGITHIEIRHVNKKNISVLTKEEVLEVKELLDKYGIKDRKNIARPIDHMTLKSILFTMENRLLL